MAPHSIMEELPSILALLCHALINIPSLLILCIFHAIDVLTYIYFQLIVHVISVIYLYHSTVTFWLYLAIFRGSFSAKIDCCCVEIYQNPSHMHCTTSTSAELVAATSHSCTSAMYCDNAAM